jgi:hypothetical protein
MWQANDGVQERQAMKKPYIAIAAASRRKAQQTLEQRAQIDAAFFRERKKQEEANREKTARLKALRLAKEAADREAAPAAGTASTVTIEKAGSRKAPPVPIGGSDKE